MKSSIKAPLLLVFLVFAVGLVFYLLRPPALVSVRAHTAANEARNVVTTLVSSASISAIKCDVAGNCLKGEKGGDPVQAWSALASLSGYLLSQDPKYIAEIEGTISEMKRDGVVSFDQSLWQYCRAYEETKSLAVLEFVISPLINQVFALKASRTDQWLLSRYAMARTYQFMAWAEERRLPLERLNPIFISVYIEQLQGHMADYTKGSSVVSFRCLTVLDLYARYCLHLEPRIRYSAANVVYVLDSLAAKFGVPKQLRLDNGPEFRSRELLEWAKAKGVELAFSQPGKPQQNGFVESFHSRFRYECLSPHRFTDIQHAGRVIEEWREEYNERRPHSALGGQPPASRMFARHK